MFLYTVLIICSLYQVDLADDPNRVPTKCEGKSQVGYHEDERVSLLLRTALLCTLLSCRHSLSTMNHSVTLVCKLLAQELSENFQEHNSASVIDTSYSLDAKPTKRTKYSDS